MIGKAIHAFIARYVITGAALFCLGTVLWAVGFHGPSQYRAGGLEKAVELDQATKEAANGLANKAEAARLAYDVCTATGGVYQFSTGECQR